MTVRLRALLSGINFARNLGAMSIVSLVFGMVLIGKEIAQL